MKQLIQNLTYMTIMLVEVLLSLRFITRLFGANPKAPFIAWLYENTAPLLAPFSQVFPAPSVNGKFVLEFTTLFAIFVYSFIAYLALELLSIFNTFGEQKKK